MFTISTSIELPIAHCLYRGAYSGLCCGNVYRDMKDDGTKERYSLDNGVLPIIHGHNYKVTIDLSSNELDKNGMVVDFKKLKKIIHEFFDKYDHSMILTPDNPLVDIYKKNYEEHGIDFNRSRLFVWDCNPTAEYMGICWYSALMNLFDKEDFVVSKLAVTVEETSHNKITYTE